MLGKCRGIDGAVVDTDAALARKLAKDNKRLAAAAPELLAALKGLIKAVEQYRSDAHSGVESSVEYGPARALIARLEGKG